MVFGTVGWQCLVGSHFGSDLWVDVDGATAEALEQAWSSRTTLWFKLDEWPQYLYHSVYHSDGKRSVFQKNISSGTVRELRRVFIVPR
jgi:hypothetical protein